MSLGFISEAKLGKFRSMYSGSKAVSLWAFIGVLFFCCSLPSKAQDLSKFSWLAGEWKGNAFGGEVYENWTSPKADEMLGSFQLIKDGKNTILEFMAIRVAEDTVRMFFNHFNPDLERWEDEPIRFGLEYANEDEFKFLNMKEGETAPRSLKYHFDKTAGKLIVVVEEWEKTTAGYESFSVTYFRN